MNEYDIIPCDGSPVTIQAELIRETEDVVLFFAKGYVVGIAPLMNIIAVKKTSETDKID